MSDDIFDGLSNFMRPVVSSEYTYEPKTKLPEMKWRDATPEEIALSALGQMNNTPMTATEVLARQKEAYGKPNGALAPLTAAHVAWLEKLVRPPVGSALKNQPHERLPGCLTYASDPEIPVTPEMIEAGCDKRVSFSLVMTYRAMAALAPKDREILILRAEREAWKHMYEELRGKTGAPDARMLRADETGNHNYHGPTKDGKAVPDPVHERAHEVVGDILGGRIIRPARDQMEKALADARVKDGKTPAEIPTTPNLSDPRRIGG